MSSKCKDQSPCFSVPHVIESCAETHIQFGSTASYTKVKLQIQRVVLRPTKKEHDRKTKDGLTFYLTYIQIFRNNNLLISKQTEIMLVLEGVSYYVIH